MHGRGKLMSPPLRAPHPHTPPLLPLRPHPVHHPCQICHGHSAETRASQRHRAFDAERHRVVDERDSKRERLVDEKKKKLNESGVEKTDTKLSPISPLSSASLFTSTPVISHAVIRSFFEAFEQEQKLETQNELLFGSDASEYEDETESEGSLSTSVESQKIPLYELNKAIQQSVSAVVLIPVYLTFLNFNLLSTSLKGSSPVASVSDTHTLLNMRSLAHSLFCTPALNTTAAAIPPNTICSCESHKY
ncbi:hypothetical protein BLNAU_10996 [Blattamonas nauphoetae]|uniref:Uncharacterized protein n=1 Tax=Blattamonas nauphoetae TaxID=2049346 RepID=A0ABQ9XRF8_9EUKA|nr:hypothetical protein BLNAU_10996 [Blattamonas nauphoetae]